MHINPIASIRRAVLGPARHEGVPACHGPCLGLVKDLPCQHGTAHRAERAWKCRPDTARGTRGPGRHGTARPKSQL